MLFTSYLLFSNRQEMDEQPMDMFVWVATCAIEDNISVVSYTLFSFQPQVTPI